MTFENTTDEELIILYHKQAREMSFYNAGEGQSWYAEADARAACSAEFRKIMEELKRREMEIPKGNYLV